MADAASPYLGTVPKPADIGVARKALDQGSLQSVPVAMKDIIVTADGRKSTAASKMLAPYGSPYDATVVRKMLKAGAEVVGKTNLDEFAMGASTENSALGKTVNPWDPERVPGGSSGGSAAAVASRSVPVALGTDTGGSVRQPAAFCGVVGLKPTYGRVSRYGLIAMASSLDQAGTFTTTVADAATVLGTIAGPDPLDATSVDREVPDYRKALTGDVKGLTVGIPKEYFEVEGGVQLEIGEAIEQAKGDLRKAGAKVVDVSLPHTKYAVSVYYLVMPAEASSNLARYDGIRYGHSVERDADWQGSLEDVYFQSRAQGFGPEVQRRIMLGTYALSAGYYDAYYKKAMQVRTLVTRDFEQAFEKVDLLLTPTTPTTAFKFEEKADDPLAMYLADIFTVPASLAGLPAVSVPAGFDKQNLPIGLQLIGKHWGEATVLRAAHAYEQRHDWHTKEPPR
jgi:aspartyl-tRNA(Asn)/glutamyl-tRNA(Gln) amidotransferase subunit A